jgi:hypothetical protein
LIVRGHQICLQRQNLQIFEKKMKHDREEEEEKEEEEEEW